MRVTWSWPKPSNLDVFIGEKGVLWMKIRALGRTGHGSMPWLGINAVSYMARLIPRLEEYPFPFEESSLLGKPTISVNMIEGGNKVNVVPDRVRDHARPADRPKPGSSGHSCRARTSGNRRGARFPSDLRIEVEVQEDVGSLETDRAEPLVDAIVSSVREVRGQEPVVGGVTYGTDAAYLGPGFNIPMVICGPGAQGMAHQPDEYVHVEQLVQAVAIYTDLARRLLG